jgi:[acyl-carrier-protein] S-malonyltransferase
MLGDVLAIVSPGQGSQRPAMLKSWAHDAKCAEYLHWLSAVCGLDLQFLGTDADAETIRPTAVTQPLLVASGLVATYALACELYRPWPIADVVAGHSVGELTAAAIAGAIGPEQAMVLARERGTAMARIASKNDSGMAAILGGDPAEVAATIEDLGLVAVNDNGPGHVVVSGARQALVRLLEARPRRSRVVPLEISGGFHSIELAPVTELLRGYARSMSAGVPRARLLSNADGRVVRTGREALDRIAVQVSSPVKWNLCMRRMEELGVTGILEVPPAGTLTRIAHRAMPGVELFALDTVGQLDDACAFAVRHLGIASRARTSRGGRAAGHVPVTARPASPGNPSGSSYPSTTDREPP